MLMHPATDFVPVETVAAPRPAPDACLTLLPGSLVETATGWTDAADLTPGDRVQTLDGGQARIAGLTRRPLTSRDGVAMHIPGGALDNCSDLILPGVQRLGLIHPTCERLFGAPCVLVQAHALAGFRGIAPAPAPVAGAQIVTELQMAEEELVYAQTGLLLCAPSARQPAYRRLSYGEARALLAVMSGGSCGVDPHPARAA